eukprot:5999956-Pleurochrysis_carterae.AAC.2
MRSRGRNFWASLSRASVVGAACSHVLDDQRRTNPRLLAAANATAAHRQPTLRSLVPAGVFLYAAYRSPTRCWHCADV